MKNMPLEVVAYLEELKVFKELDAGKAGQRRPKPSPQVIEYFQALALKKRLYEIPKCKDRKTQYDIEAYTEELKWLIQQIHSEVDKQIVFVSKQETKNYGTVIGQQAITISELTDYRLFRLISLGQKVNLYKTTSTFNSSYRRTSDLAFSASCFAIDIDYYNIPELASMDAQSVYKLILKEVLEPMGLKASFAVNSGRGLYLYWLLSEPLIFTDENRALYSNLLKKLIYLLEPYGADKNAADISRVLRIPQSRNQKTNAISYIMDFDIIKDNPLKYNIEEIAAKLESIEPTAAAEPKPKKKKPGPKAKAKPAKKADRPQAKKAKKTQPHHFTALTLATNRVQDLEAWITARGYDIEGCRNSFFLIYFTALLECDMDDLEWDSKTLKDKKNPYDRAEKLFNKVHSKTAEDKYSLDEFKRTYKSALENQQKRRDNQKGYFSFSNENIINRLGITADEQKMLSCIISYREKLNRQLERERRARRNEAGKTSRQQKATDNYNMIHSLLSENKSVKDISSMTGLSKSIIYNIKKFSNETLAL